MPSGIKKNQDKHEARDLISRGLLGFPRNVKLIEAEREQRRGSSRRRKTGFRN